MLDFFCKLLSDLLEMSTGRYPWIPALALQIKQDRVGIVNGQLL